MMVKRHKVVLIATVILSSLVVVPAVLAFASKPGSVSGNDWYGMMGGYSPYAQGQESGTAQAWNYGYGMMGGYSPYAQGQGNGARSGWNYGYGMMGGFEGDFSSKQSQQPPAQQVNGSYQVVKVVASDWKWTLSTNHLKYGEPVKFVVLSTQGTHGFSIFGTNISEAVSAGNQPETIIWKPKSKGTYTIACDIYCGPGHGSMVTTLSVS